MTTMRQLAAKHVLTSLERRRIATGAAQAENKYKAQRLGAFDSKLEMRGFGELQIRERLGEITELKIHPRFPIIWPGQTEPFTTVEMDASFKERGVLHVIDWKGHDTALSRLKRKLLKQAYGIETEVIKKVRS